MEDSKLVSQNKIYGYRELLEQQGYLYLQNLGDSFDFLNFAQEFGPLLRQYDKKVIWSIKAKDGFEDSYHSMNTNELTPHTECYEFDGIPPKYLVLWCVEPGSQGEGATYLCDVLSHILNQISPLERSKLETTSLRYFSTSGLVKEDLGREAFHPLLSYEKHRKPVIRFSEQCMDYAAELHVEGAILELNSFIENNKLSIDWTKNSFLIWDNHRMVHSRSSFSNRERELKRLWIAAA